MDSGGGSGGGWGWGAQDLLPHDRSGRGRRSKEALLLLLLLLLRGNHSDWPPPPHDDGRVAEHPRVKADHARVVALNHVGRGGRGPAARHKVVTVHLSGDESDKNRRRHNPLENEWFCHELPFPITYKLTFLPSTRHPWCNAD